MPSLSNILMFQTEGCPAENTQDPEGSSQDGHRKDVSSCGKI